MRILNKIIKEHKLLLIAIGLGILFFSGFLLFNNQIFIFEGDVLNQNVKMTLQAWEKFHSGEGFLWNWSNFLGASYIGTATYYGFGSVFFWLMMCVPYKEWVIPMFLYTNILKTILCILFTYLWIYQTTKSKKGAFVASLIVSFSGFVLTNYNNNVMFDAICFMPLALACAEYYIRTNKGVYLSLVIGIIGLANYYFLYLFLPFLSLYTLTRYLICYQFNWLSCIKKAAGFLGYVLLGIGCCAVLLVPSFFALMNNTRASELPSLFSTISKFDLFRFITGFLNPINDWRLNNNYFVNTTVYAGVGYSGGMAVYSFMIFPFLFPLIFAIKNKKEKWGLLFLYGLYSLFVLFQIFYVLFNQNLESRWMMNIIFLNALLVATLIQYRKNFTWKHYLLCFILSAGLIIACLFMTYHFYLSPEIWGWKILVRNCIIGIFILVGYLILFGLEKKVKFFQSGLVVMLAIELFYSQYNIFYNDGYNLDPMTKEELSAYQLFDNAVIEMIQEDDSFYRIDLQTLPVLHENDSYVYNYHSFNGYTSIYNFNQSDFINGRFKIEHAWNFYPQPGKWLLKSKLGSKYFIKSDDQDIIPYGYFLWKTVGKNEIYMNAYHLPFAYAKTGVISENTLRNYSIFEQDRLLINNVAMDTKEENIDTALLDNLKLLNENMSDSFQIDVSEMNEGIMYIEFLEHTSVAYEIFDENDEMIDYNYLIRDLNYASIPIGKNAHRINITVLNPVNVYFDSMNWYDSWYKETSEKAVTDVIWKDGIIAGNITLENPSYIFTSIPYDKGWSYYENGKKNKYFKADNGFIGIYLEVGTHYIEFEFLPLGMKFGSFLSVSSIIFVILLIIRDRKK